SSRVRRLAGFDLVKTSPPMDVLWFRIERKAYDPEGVLARFGRGHALVMLDRLDQWQIAYVILKGTYQQIHAAGLGELRRSIAEMIPEMAERLDALQDWKQVSVLSVESSRVKQWYLPGLLLIGDAAHVMSPVGGVGINYAIQDAVPAAEILTEPLKEGKLETSDLQKVQKMREWPTRAIQWLQAQVQKRVITTALNTNQTF